MKISGSIVVYNEKLETLKRVVDNFLQIDLEKELIIVDNSPLSYLEDSFINIPNVKFIFSGENLGFGKAHNRAFRNLSIDSDIHLIINPDIYFNPSLIKEFLLDTFKDNTISLAIPMVCNIDGSRQNVVRDIPTPMTLIKRRLNIKGIFDDFIALDEYIDVYKSINGFDERFFMYMEDVDIFIQAKKYGKTVINPKYKIFHEYRKGSSKKLKLLWVHLISAFKFFSKYK